MRKQITLPMNLGQIKEMWQTHLQQALSSKKTVQLAMPIQVQMQWLKTPRQAYQTNLW